MSTDLPTFQPSGVITLTTDFGTSDPFVGIMKGVILARCPHAKIVDLTHNIPTYVPKAAGFWLARSWSYFPEGTVHLAVIDPGVGTERAMLAIRRSNHVFVAPDNGLLDEIAAVPEAICWHIELGRLQPFLPPHSSHTFHGRDIFAPLVAEISAGRLQPEQLGDEVIRKPATPVNAVGERGELAGQIVVIDHFGNLITDIEVTALRRFSKPRVYFREQQYDLHATYGAAAPGKLIALINSFGVLELAQVQGNAQRALNARYGEKVRVRDE